MKTKKSKILIISLIGIFSLLLISYIIMTCISSKYFQKNTIINGTDFSYCKIEDVIESLNSKYDDYHLDVKLRDKTFTINPKDIDLVITAKNDLIKIKDDQNAFLWFTYLFGTNEYTANYQISYSENKLTSLLMSMPEFNIDNMIKPKNATVEIVDGQPQIVEGSKGTEFDTEKAINLIKSNISDLNTEVSIEDAGYYTIATYDSNSDIVKNFYNTIKSYTDLNIKYNYVENVSFDIPHEEICKMIDIDSDNYKCSINKDKIAEFVAKFAEEHDTFGKDRLFKTSIGKTVKVNSNSLGWEIDQEAEVEELYKNLIDKKDIEREPIFSHQGKVYTADCFDIGDSYVEFNFTDQKVYFYMNGKHILTDDIISGNPNRYQNTPGGLYEIYSMSYDVVLTGPGYASHVDYWMPFNGEIGMHDAHWQSKFGGDLYLSRGSHGCVNLPYKTAQTIWDMGYRGLPVIGYWQNSDYIVD